MDQHVNVSIAKDVNRSAGIVLHDDKILLMHRRNQGKEYYTFPGGGIELHETPEETVIRELMEETSIAVVPTRLLYEVLWDSGTPQSFFLCSYQSGTPSLGEYMEKETMRVGPDQYYNPLWIETACLANLLLYPLEIRDRLIEDLKSDFAVEKVTLELGRSTCRQTL